MSGVRKCKRTMRNRNAGVKNRKFLILYPGVAVKIKMLSQVGSVIIIETGGTGKGIQKRNSYDFGPSAAHCIVRLKL